MQRRSVRTDMPSPSSFLGPRTSSAHSPFERSKTRVLMIPVGADLQDARSRCYTTEMVVPSSFGVRGQASSPPSGSGRDKSGGERVRPTQSRRRQCG